MFDGSPLGNVSRDVRQYEGLPMTILDGRTTGPRLQFQTTVTELWKTWCELQTSYAYGADGAVLYSCAPYSGGYRYSQGFCVVDLPCGRSERVDCGRLTLCQPSGGVCQCTASGCTADPTGDSTFDVRVVGTNIDGSVNLFGQLHNVHLTRMP
jgi:hypothetical protein